MIKLRAIYSPIGPRTKSGPILVTLQRHPVALPILVLLFVGSGCAALMYEVIWFQLLQLVIGSSSSSLGVLLGTFMGGMCLGSLMLPRIIDQRRHPLRVYAGLELTIAVCGLVLVWAMPLVGEGYDAFGGGRLTVRVAIACVCLLPPTMAMGATLPAVARWVETSPGGVSWLGFFYAGNIVGAVAGALITGFYLLRVFDVNVATYGAVAINIAVAASSWWLAMRAAAPTATGGPSSHLTPHLGAFHVVVALSGFTALAAEVMWTRLLALTFGATVYTFSLVLAAFLIGLGTGSGVGAWIARSRSVRPHAALGWCQILLCVAIASGAYLMARVIPFWPMADVGAHTPWRAFADDFLRALLVVLPAAVLWGASFPLTVAAAAAPHQDAGRLVGGVYAANTAGAIAGALVTSLLLAGAIGSQHVQQLLIGVAAIAGMLAFSFHESVRPAVSTGLAFTILVLVPTVPPVPAPLIAYGRRSPEWVETAKVADMGRILYAGEGLNDFVAVSGGAGGERYYHAAGKVQASTLREDMRLQLLLAHLSHLVPARPSNVLVIGCGAGITAGALAIGPGVEHVTIADIEALVPQVAAAFFGDVNHHIIDDPRVSMRIDDGRHYLATTDQTFDVITTDLIDPWVKGVASLFTREFFQSVKRHLRPGGVVTQFVQLYQSSPDAVKSEIATFVDAFPHAIVWGNPHDGRGYDLVLLGQVEPTRIDVDELDARLARPEFGPVRESLRSIGVESATDLLGAYAAEGSALRPWLAGTELNTDRNLRLQYLAGLGMDRDESGPIYAEIVRDSTFPQATFSGTVTTLERLRLAIAARRPR
jgi:spermidine synthase